MGEVGLARATALLEVGRTEAARRAATDVLAADPDDVAALCLVARSYQVEDDFLPMRDAAARAVEVAPGEREGHLLLALANIGLDDGPRALAGAAEAVRLDPDDWRAHAALAMAEFNLVHRRRAFRSIRRAIELAPDVGAPHFVRALMFHAIGWTLPAKRSYRRAVELDPENAAALTGLGRIAAGGGRLAVAAGHISAVLAAEPGDHAARTALDRLVLVGLGGWGLAAVWGAGFLALFAMLPWLWLPPLLVPALWWGWAARTWRALSPGARAYAGRLLRDDVRARVRLAGLALCGLTALGLDVTAAFQDPDRPPSAAMLVVLGAHVLALLVTVAAAVVADRKVGATPADPAQPRPTDLLAENRETTVVGRWMLRLTRVGAIVGAPLWVLGVDPASTWAVRAVAATVALAAFLGYAEWSRRRLIRRPGPPNAALGTLSVPLTLAALVELATIVVTGLVPRAPLPSFVLVPSFVVITAGLLAWLGWLPYAVVRGLVRLARRAG